MIAVSIYGLIGRARCTFLGFLGLRFGLACCCDVWRTPECVVNSAVADLRTYYDLMEIPYVFGSGTGIRDLGSSVGYWHYDFLTCMGTIVVATDF